MIGTRLAVGLAIALGVSCAGAGPGPSADAAQQALGRSDYAAARAAAEAGLQSVTPDADETLVWRLERLRLEACAGLCDAAEVLGTLERLAGTHPRHADAQLHARVGNQLLAAGEVTGAAQVVGVALERFPDHSGDLEPIVEALSQLAEHGSDEDRERLANIPYLSGR